MLYLVLTVVDDIAIAEAIAAVERELKLEKQKATNYQSIIFVLVFVIVGIVTSQFLLPFLGK